MTQTKFIRQQAFDVYSRQSLHVHDLFPSRDLRCIDTVFYSERPRMSTDEVRRSLINHDGYPADIVVVARRKGR